MRKVLLIVPAFNEEDCLPITRDMLAKQPYDYIIVNDGSSDSTGRLAKSLAMPVIDLPFNQGLSGAFAAGMLYAQREGYDYALQFDADGQHLPEYVQPLLDMIEKEGVDVVIGSRFVEEPMPATLRTLGSKLIQLMMKLTTGQKITDPTSGMRIYNRRMIELFARHMDLSPEPDTLAYLMRNGFKVAECQVSMQERVAGISYLASWSAAKYMIKMAFSILLIQFARSPINKEEEKI